MPSLPPSAPASPVAAEGAVAAKEEAVAAKEEAAAVKEEAAAVTQDAAAITQDATAITQDATALSLLLEQHSRVVLKRRLAAKSVGSGQSDGRDFQTPVNPAAGDEADQPTFPGSASILALLDDRHHGPAIVRERLVRRALAVCRTRHDDAGVMLLGPNQASFPGALANIPDAPLLLHCRGDLAAFNRPAVAIVGARRASRTGLDTAGRLAADLAEAGAAIVSGLALGVDAAAHRGALSVGGVTIAVLGSGVDRIQPVANTRLARRILDSGGLILSEYPLGTPAAPYRFPERNRLIAGLSRGVVVVEASLRSGSLITARLALEQGREVMAVPGAPGQANSAGVNRLLKAGAALIEGAEDVLLAIGSDLRGVRAVLESEEPAGLSGEQLSLFDLLDGRAQSLDELTASTGLNAQACAVTLTELELGGFVQRVTGGYIRRPSDF